MIRGLIGVQVMSEVEQEELANQIGQAMGFRKAAGRRTSG